MAMTEHRAGQLAQLAHLEQLALPAAVRTAIAGYEAVLALPVPAPPERGAERRAITALADSLARDALNGKHPVPTPQPLDVTPVTAARQAEQDGLDRATLARELRAAAAVVLCQVFSGKDGQQMIGAVQERHREVMGELCRHARLLPPGADDQAALEAGGQTRESYLAARDLTATVTQLREAVALIEDSQPPYVPDGLEICLAYEKTGRLYTTWLAPIASTAHGALGSFGFYLSACREPDYEWWCPASGELEARATQLRDQMQASRAAGLDPAHVF